MLQPPSRKKAALGVATCVAVGVAAYLVVQRELRDAEFVALLGLLLIALAMAAAGRFGEGVEGFADVMDSSVAIYNEILRPKLDRLVSAVGGERSVNTTGEFKMYKEDDERTMKEASGADIARATGTQSKPATSLKVANEFRLISAFLCNCAQSVDKAVILKSIDLGAPVYND